MYYNVKVNLSGFLSRVSDTLKKIKNINYAVNCKTGIHKVVLIYVFYLRHTCNGNTFPVVICAWCQQHTK